jgi:hypothetical protein
MAFYLGLGLSSNDISSMAAMSGNFFDLSRRADLALEWLQQNVGRGAITDRMVSWLAHLCLQQMRIDVLRTIQRDISPDVRPTILHDSIQFCHNGLLAILPGGLTRVSGNRADFQSPFQVARALFGYNDSQVRSHWEDKPFCVLYQQICGTLQQCPIMHPW